MSKKKIITIVTSIIITVALILVAFYFVVPKITSDNNVPDPVATEPADPTATTDDLVATDQFTSIANSENQYSPFFANGNLGGLDSVELTLATWTVDKYVKNAIINPYFVSGYWAGEDAYASDSVKSYISPYLSAPASEATLLEAAQVKAGVTPDSFASKVYMPTSGLTVPQECYDTWETEYCFATPYIVNDFSYQGENNGTITVKTNITVNTLYQKPDSPQGNLSSQERNYDLTFSLKKTNEPASVDTEVPIMIIENVTGSLVINDLQDYLLNEG